MIDIYGVVKIVNDFSPALLACLTLLLAILTGLMAYEAKRKREDDNSPNVVVTVEPSKEYLFWLELIVENTGKGVAYSIDVEMEPDITYSFSRGDLHVSDLGLNKIHVLKPAQKVKYFIGNYNNISPNKTEVKVTCKNIFNRSYIFRNTIDISMYDKMSTASSNLQKEQVKEIKKISESIVKIASGRSAISIKIDEDSH